LPFPTGLACLPPLDDWKDGHPDAWDYDAVLEENGVVLVDGKGNEHRAGILAGLHAQSEATTVRLGGKDCALIAPVVRLCPASRIPLVTMAL